MVIFNVSLYFR